MKRNLVTMKNRKFWTLAGFVCALVLCILLGSKALWVEAAPGTITTADSRADGITMNLFDYWGSSDKDLDNGSNVPVRYGDWPTGRQNGINAGHRLQFTSYGVDGNTLNHFMGANNPARPGIVESRLGSDGYPVLTNNGTLKTNGESLAYLFNDSDQSGKKIYKDVNRLLSKDDQGTYQYDSNKNYAYYPSQGGGGDFKVYNGTYNTSNNTSYKIGFFPFTDYNDSQTNIDNRNNTHYNHHFGMTMNANFSLPHNGKLPNGKDMVFEYSGDDDMWLYIDGVLVLDLGGIHEPVHGTINFATDEVKTWPQNKPGNVKTTTLSAIFAQQGVTWRNDTDHKFDMFYLERGGQYSNLELTLNIPITKTVTVNKSVEGEQSADYLDKDFQFRALVDKGDGHGYVPYEGNVEIYGVTTHVSDGKFKLKPTQRAKLLDMKSSWKYRVEELGVDGSHFSGVDISGSDTKTIPLSDGQSGLTASSGEVSASTRNNELNFKNKIREEKKNISVEKKWEGDGEDDRPQSIQFRLYRIKNGDTEHKEPYRDAQGNTIFTLNAGNWQKTFNGLVTKSGKDTYTYEVEEVSVPTGYVVSYSGSSDGTALTIKNEMKTKVKVEKKWQQADGSPLENPPDQVKVQLYQYKMAEKSETVPNPPSTEKHKVLFKTTYRAVDGQGGSGSNHGSDPKYNGDYELTQYVTKDGSIEFTVKAFQTKFGVLSVEVNNGSLSRLGFTQSSTHSYVPNGQSNYTPIITEARYKLDHITADTTVTVNMIGWLSYPPQSPTSSVAASMDIRNIVTSEPTPTGTTTITTKPTPPEKMPAIGTEGLTTYGDPKTITASNHWETTFPDLPVQTTENGKTYYYFYYVKEVDGPPGFTTTDEGNDGTSGSVTIKNVKDYFPLGFTKVDSTDGNKHLAGAEFSLYKDEACQNVVEVYLTKEMQGNKVTTFSSNQQGEVRVFGLKPGVYYLKETKAPKDYYLIEKPMMITINDDGRAVPAPGNDNIVLNASNSSQVIVRDNPIYELPNAGGIGTHVLTLLGSMLLSIGAIILYDRKKRFEHGKASH